MCIIRFAKDDEPDVITVPPRPVSRPIPSPTAGVVSTVAAPSGRSSRPKVHSCQHSTVSNSERRRDTQQVVQQPSPSPRPGSSAHLRTTSSSSRPLSVHRYTIDQGRVSYRDSVIIEPASESRTSQNSARRSQTYHGDGLRRIGSNVNRGYNVEKRKPRKYTAEDLAYDVVSDPPARRSGSLKPTLSTRGAHERRESGGRSGRERTVVIEQITPRTSVTDQGQIRTRTIEPRERDRDRDSERPTIRQRESDRERERETLPEETRSGRAIEGPAIPTPTPPISESRDGTTSTTTTTERRRRVRSPSRDRTVTTARRGDATTPNAAASTAERRDPSRETSLWRRSEPSPAREPESQAPSRIPSRALERRGSYERTRSSQLRERAERNPGANSDRDGTRSGSGIGAGAEGNNSHRLQSNEVPRSPRPNGTEGLSSH
ncbi:Serine/arginine repetitive matrix protein 2 [Agyrium rufum]|nr:Serine/arginine repetitive matrix protein 2 [Agyrium rufum]